MFLVPEITVKASLCKSHYHNSILEKISASFFFPTPPLHISPHSGWGTVFWHPLWLISHVRYELIFQFIFCALFKSTRDPGLYFLFHIQPASLISVCHCNVFYFTSFICILRSTSWLQRAGIQCKTAFYFPPPFWTDNLNQPNKNKETWKPHLLHKALQMQCLLAMLQLFCASAHASLELTRFKAEIPLPGTFTFCKAVTLRGEHRAFNFDAGSVKILHSH